MQKNVFLRFSQALVDKPVISTLIRKYDVEVNILQATITPNEEGAMFVQLLGAEEKLEQSLGYLVGAGVDVMVKPRRISWNSDLCTSCGACVGHCLPKALFVNTENRRVEYDEELCIACELCIPACPYGALEMTPENVEGGA